MCHDVRGAGVRQLVGQLMRRVTWVARGDAPCLGARARVCVFVCVCVCECVSVCVRGCV